MDRAQWLQLLDLAPDEVPQLLVTEGTWWRERARAARLADLTDVRELGMPDLWWGRYDGVPVAWCPAYGASRVVEPVHVLGVCGTPLAVQIGSCGGLAPHLRTGDLLLSSAATVDEGASAHYGGGSVALPDRGLLERLRDLLPLAHVGPTVTTEALLAQPDELVAAWAAQGHLGVDLETSAVFSAARAHGVAAASVLFVWDELPGRSWTDAFTAEETAAQRAADALTWATALRLVSGQVLGPVA